MMNETLGSYTEWLQLCRFKYEMELFYGKPPTKDQIKKFEESDNKEKLFFKRTDKFLEPAKNKQDVTRN